MVLHERRLCGRWRCGQAQSLYGAATGALYYAVHCTSEAHASRLDGTVTPASLQHQHSCSWRNSIGKHVAAATAEVPAVAHPAAAHACPVSAATPCMHAHALQSLLYQLLYK